jgi:hypothetical protein
MHNCCLSRHCSLSAILALIDRQSQDCRNLAFFSIFGKSSFEKISQIGEFLQNNPELPGIFMQEITPAKTHILNP